MYTFVLGLSILVAAPAKKDPPKREPPSVVGEWLGESGVKGGKNDPPPPGTTITFTKEGEVLFKEGGNGMNGEKGSYSVDVKKDPAEMDITPPGPGKGPKMMAIFKIEGDTLTIALGMTERPKTFTSPDGSDVMLITCKRVKKD